MANDRVFIKCKGCGGWKMLLKYFPGEGLTTRDNGILEWLDTHRYCHSVYQLDPEHFGLQLMTLHGDPGFTLHTEADFQNELPMNKQNRKPDGTQA